MSMSIPSERGPRDVAEELGVSPDMLRQLCGSRYFGEFLDGHKTPQGHRRFTPQDVAVLRYAVQRQKRGVNYESTKELLRTKGVAWCLSEELGFEGENAVLLAQVEQLKAALASERDRNLRLERIEQQYEKARALALTVLHDATVRKQVAREQIVRATEQVEETLAEIRSLKQSLWARLFPTRLARAEAKLEGALMSQRDAQGMFESLSLLELQVALNLQLSAGWPKENHDAYPVMDVAAAGQRDS